MFQFSDAATGQLRFLTIADNSGISFVIDGGSAVDLHSSVNVSAPTLFSSVAMDSTFVNDCVMSDEATGLVDNPRNSLR